jgi:endonuclease/exonuclease/phosphatase family metal-dependent hydrolase
MRRAMVQSSGMHRLRIITINIWNRQGPWERRLPLLEEGLAALDPDLVGLQEVLRLDGTGDQAQELAAPLGLVPTYGEAMRIMDGPLGMGNALLSRWPVVESRVFPLPVTRAAEARSLLYALVSSPRGPLPVYVTHLTWELHLGDERARQVRAIDDFVRQSRPREALPALLLGDFNAEPDSDEIRFLRGLTSLGARSTYWADCFGVVGQGPGFTYSRANAYARVLREPSRRIDYVFVRGPDRDGRGEPLVARVVLDRPSGSDWPSDHFGVYVEVSC